MGFLLLKIKTELTQLIRPEKLPVRHQLDEFFDDTNQIMMSAHVVAVMDVYACPLYRQLLDHGPRYVPAIVACFHTANRTQF